MDALLTDYQLVSMRDDQLVVQYVDRVGSLDKRLAATGKMFSDDNKIRTMLRKLPIRFATTGDLIRVLGKRHSEAVAMLMAKEAEQESSGHKLQPTYTTENSFALKKRSSQGCFLSL